MEKIAVIELGASSVRLMIANVIENEHFYVEKEFLEPLRLALNIEKNGLLKPAKIAEAIGVLRNFKKIGTAFGVKKYVAIATNSIMGAKNYRSFLDEINNVCALEFKILTNEEEVNAIYTGIINTLDIPKGIIVDVSADNVRIINYNRRIILGHHCVPFGVATVLELYANEKSVPTEQCNKMQQFFEGQLVGIDMLNNLDPDTQIIGVGGVFQGISRISRVRKKYPVDADHNYPVSTEDFNAVYSFIKGLDLEKRQKLKGISAESTDLLASGLSIVSAILNTTKTNKLVVSSAGRRDGLLFNYAIPGTLEKPIGDCLGHSLETVARTYGFNLADCSANYALSIMLFKQLKVLHKLSRPYVKVLRIASYLYTSGQKVNYNNFEKHSFYTILNGNIYGATHKELVLAAFASSVKKWEDFKMNEWIKYTDMVTDEDLDAVRKLSIILAIAEGLNVSRNNIVKDITCDILGDSVILKLICEQDAGMEIFYAKKYSAEFAKAFKKNLEIL